MRSTLLRAAALLTIATPAFASEGAEPAKADLLTPAGGLMVWTLVIFGALFFVLKKFAFGPILEGVTAREQALQQAMDDAKADRDAAAKLLADHQAKIAAARDEAQKLIADGRATAEAMRAELLEQTKAQQAEMLERARREIETEKTKAIADLRREAVDLALAGAGKLIEQKLDDAGNRKLVEQFLSTLGSK